MGFTPVKTIKVKVTTFEDLLGTAPSDDQLYRDYIASKSPNKATIEDEVASVGVDEVEMKGTTIFSKDKDGKPFLWDYQIKGFFKDAAGMLTKVIADEEEAESDDNADETADKDAPKKKGRKKKSKYPNETSKVSAYKKKIDGLIFVFPRKIPIVFDGEMGICQRPLRAQTAQGERIAIASSESIPEGAEIEFTIEIFSADLVKPVLEWLDYGRYRGLNQWRNSGKGRFTYDILEEK